MVCILFDRDGVDKDCTRW